MSVVDSFRLSLTVSEHFLGAIAASIHVCGLCVVFSVVGQVASLAPVPQVVQVAILRRVVQVAGRQHND